MTTCTHCQAEVDNQTQICPNCGKLLGKSDEVTVCPHCGAASQLDDYFCHQCGAVLVFRRTTERLPWSQEVYWATEKTAAQQIEGPYLVINPTGAIVGLPSAGQIILGREDPVAGVYPDINLTPFGAEKYGVSRRHARITLQGDFAFIEDLGSLNGTFLNRRLLRPRVRCPLYEGDEVQLAGLTLTFHNGS